MAEPALYAAIQRFKGQLAAGEAQSAKRLVEAYGRIYQKLQDEIAELEKDIAALGPNATPGQVARLARYKALLRDTAAEMKKYAALLKSEVVARRGQAVDQALAHSPQIVQLALPHLPPPARATLMAQFNRLPKEAVVNLLGALQEGSPLADLFAQFGDQAALELGHTILQGVAIGYNPIRVAAQIRANLGGNLSRALTITRTEMLRAHRTASLASYAANPDIVKGWRWMATKKLNPPPCLACLALDGRRFGADEPFMKAHPN